MPARPLHILRVNRPNLLRQIHPLRLRKSARLLGRLGNARRRTVFHIDVDELDRIILVDVRRKRIAAEHLRGGLLLPHEQAEPVQTGHAAQDRHLDIGRDVLQMPRVLIIDLCLGNRHHRRHDRQLSIRNQHPRSLAPHLHQIVDVLLIRGLPNLPGHPIINHIPIRRAGNRQRHARIRQLPQPPQRIPPQNPVHKPSRPTPTIRNPVLHYLLPVSLPISPPSQGRLGGGEKPRPTPPVAPRLDCPYYSCSAIPAHVLRDGG